jgi:2-oxoglutarate ferredoxin oxidoreductase subunit beta
LALPHISQSINPLALAIAAGYTFVARSYSFDAKHLKQTIMAAIEHRGISLVDVHQPCPTYNDLHPKEYYSEKVMENGTEMPRVYYLDDTGYDGVVVDSSDVEAMNTKKIEAIERAYKLEERIAFGVYWKVDMPTYDRLQSVIPALRGTSPITIPFHDEDMIPTTDLSYAYEEFLV